MECHDAQFGR